jgi:DNA-binding winged helix-turn-helix (wHTH) protein/tetratricopeptide (TPR) repeat protein
VPLGPKAYETLLFLVRSAGRAVRRQELIDAVWPDAVVGEGSLDWTISQIRKSLGDTPEQPVFVETVRGFGYRFAVAVSVAGESRPAEPAASERKRIPAWVAFAVALVALGLTGGWLARSRASHAGGRRSVAILGFQNLSGRPDAAWLSTALSEMLDADLSAGGRLRTVPSESVARMKAELALPDASSLSKATLTRAGRILGTDLVVTGSYVVVGERPDVQLRVDVRLQDAASGETLATVSESAREAELFSVVSRAGALLRERLKAGALSPGEADFVRGALPANRDAARYYAEGLDRLRRYDAKSARDLLTKAVAQEPGFALAHSALAEAWAALGQDGLAREESRLALEHSARLAPEDRLLVEGRAHEMAAERESAVASYRALAALHPDDVDEGLRLASAETAAGDGKSALETIEGLRRLPPAAAGDPRLELAEAEAAESLSDFARSKAAAGRAIAKAEPLGAKLLVARALVLQTTAAGNTGDGATNLASLERAKNLFRASGDLAGVTLVLRSIGGVRMFHGDFDGAIQALQEAVALRREIDDRAGEAQCLNSLGGVYKKKGDLPNALARFEAAYAAFKAAGAKRGMATALNNLSAVRYDMRDYEGSLAADRDALALRREIGNKKGIAMSLGNIMLSLRDSGDLEGARRSSEEALAIAREIGLKKNIAQELFDQALLLADRGELAPAVVRFDESIAAYRELALEPDLLQARLERAGALVLSGRAREAEPEIRSVLAALRREKSAEKEMLADASLAECLLALGRVAEARAALADAIKASAGVEHERDRVDVACAAARIAAADPSVRLDAGLERLLVEAAKTGVLRERLEARLALASLAKRRADPAAAVRELKALEAEARAKGFLLIAGKAHKLLAPG